VNGSDPLVLLSSREEESRLFEAAIRSLATSDRPLEILEAGCGRAWPLKVDVPFRLTGLDSNPLALEARRRRTGDLDEFVLGDLRSADLAADRFDAIYSSFVLEHVDGAERALANLVRWLRPGGLLLLRFPDRDSAFGFCTSHTPLWMHVAYRRWVIGFRDAGKPGHGPYPAYYDAVVSRSGFRGFCAEYGLAVCEERGFPFEFRRFGWKGTLVGAVAQAVWALSGGRLSPNHNWLTYVARKTDGTPDA